MVRLHTIVIIMIDDGPTTAVAPNQRGAAVVIVVWQLLEAVFVAICSVR